jgi:hypothetical protein
MCNPFSKPKAPPGPSKEELAAMESSRRNTANALAEERRTASELKDAQTEVTNAALAGRRGRRSLLAGTRKGGGGFELAQSYQTKGNLGA